MDNKVIYLNDKNIIKTNINDYGAGDRITTIFFDIGCVVNEKYVGDKIIYNINSNIKPYKDIKLSFISPILYDYKTELLIPNDICENDGISFRFNDNIIEVSLDFKIPKKCKNLFTVDGYIALPIDKIKELQLKLEFIPLI